MYRRMCWSSLNEIPKLKVVKKEPKVVYKILHEVDGVISSPIQHDTKWALNAIKSVYMEEPYHIENTYNICYGIHCLRDIPHLRHFYWYIGCTSLFSSVHGEKIFKCILPIGTKYYENKLGEIVCNSLMVVKKI